MGLLDRLFKARPDRQPNEAPKDPSASAARLGKFTVVSYSNCISAVEALKHPVVYRCVNKIAESVQQVSWYCEPDPNVPVNERAKATDIKAINSVLISPNDIYAADQLRYWMAMNYALYGRVPFKVGISSNGKPNGLYPLTTRHVKTDLNKRGQVEGFVYGTGENAENILSRARGDKVGKPYAYVISRPNLDGSLASRDNINPSDAIGLPSQVIKLLLQRAVDTASGHPNTKYIVTAEKTMTEQQKKDLEEHLDDSTPGAEKSGNILLLTNTSAKVEKLDDSLADIHSKAPMDDMTRMIAAAFGIPVALIGLGAADAAKFANNYIESRQAFWADTIVPGYLTPIATGMTAALCPYGARIRFDLDSIEALRDRNITNAKNLESVSFLTANEKRELIGFEPRPDGDSLNAPVKAAGVGQEDQDTQNNEAV